MIKLALASMMFVGAGAASAQAPQTTLTPDQKGYIAYHYCMMQAAMAASKTAAKDEEVFAIAHAQCAATRKSVIVGQEKNAGFLAALDDADKEKQANFPSWIKGVRERRAAAAAQFGK
ncbi:hypothetical protein [uncultured Novosphingobium sp.]|uniref:hypothetical protein n=1 Tax=Novosphingobium fluoreni TaxID=1391222 RepID=UPI0037480284